MDTSDSEISFDDEGNCNHCNKFLHDSKDIIYQGEESDKRLEKILNEKLKNKNRIL